MAGRVLLIALSRTIESGGGPSKDRRPRSAPDSGSSNEGLLRCRAGGPSISGKERPDPSVVVRELKVYGSDIVLQLIGLAGRDDDAADRRPSQYPRERYAGRTYVMPLRHLLQCLHDAVALFLIDGHERTCLRESRTGRSRVGSAVLACEESASKRAPDQDADVVILGERLELVFEASTDKAVVHLRRYVFFQAQVLLQHYGSGRLP